jgi:hypothetical protein
MIKLWGLNSRIARVLQFGHDNIIITSKILEDYKESNSEDESINSPISFSENQNESFIANKHRDYIDDNDTEDNDFDDIDSFSSNNSGNNNLNNNNKSNINSNNSNNNNSNNNNRKVLNRENYRRSIFLLGHDYGI